MDKIKTLSNLLKKLVSIEMVYINNNIYPSKDHKLVKICQQTFTKLEKEIDKL